MGWEAAGSRLYANGCRTGERWPAANTAGNGSVVTVSIITGARLLAENAGALVGTVCEQTRTLQRYFAFSVFFLFAFAFLQHFIGQTLSLIPEYENGVLEYTLTLIRSTKRSVLRRIAITVTIRPRKSRCQSVRRQKTGVRGPKAGVGK